MITDEDISPTLHAWLLEQPNDKLFEIMFEALELMQGYNGRSLRYCICEAANFEKKGDSWLIPKPLGDGSKPLLPAASYWLNCAKENLSTINDSVHELKGKAICLDRQVELLNRIADAVAGAEQRIQEHEEKTS